MVSHSFMKLLYPTFFLLGAAVLEYSDDISLKRRISSLEIIYSPFKLKGTTCLPPVSLKNVSKVLVLLLISRDSTDWNPRNRESTSSVTARSISSVLAAASASSSSLSLSLFNSSCSLPGAVGSLPLDWYQTQAAYRFGGWKGVYYWKMEARIPHPWPMSLLRPCSRC
jgi:hypothetical protein